MQHGVESRLSNVFNNGGSSFVMVDISAQRNISTMPYGQNSNGRSSFGADGNVREVDPNVGNASATLRVLRGFLITLPGGVLYLVTF
jgi:hypothetical protein